MESWRHTFRDGFAPQLSTAGLEALKAALENDDQSLIQTGTTQPPPVVSFKDASVEGACAVAYCFWKGDGLTTVGQVEEAFANACYQADCALGEPTGCRRFLNRFDDEPRERFFPKLLEEVAHILDERKAQHG